MEDFTVTQLPQEFIDHAALTFKVSRAAAKTMLDEGRSREDVALWLLGELGPRLSEVVMKLI